LFDRFFVNSEASPTGKLVHRRVLAPITWTKRSLNYPGGRTYDFEGYNRLPDYEPPGELELASSGRCAGCVTDLLATHLPYHQGFNDLCEPKVFTYGMPLSARSHAPQLRTNSLT